MINKLISFFTRRKQEQEPTFIDMHRTISSLLKENRNIRAENERLREALKPFLIKHPPDVNVYGFNWLLVKPEHIRAAQDILEQNK